MQFELSSEYLDELKNAIAEENDVFIKEQLKELYAVDIALILNQLYLEESIYLYDLIDEDISSDVLLEMEDEKREALLATFSTKEIAEQLDNMDSDDAADVINELPEDIQEEVLSHLEDIEQASDIADLMSFEEGTAGSLMAKELVSVYAHETVSACIDEIRRQTESVDALYAVYVVDGNEKLIGMLSLKKLIVSHPLALIEEIFDADIISVKTSASSEDVAEIIRKYDLVVLPVIDQLGRLVGRITVDDVVDVMREEAEKDMQLMSGITDDVDSNDNLWRLSRARIPWLLVGMCGGIIGSRIIGGYEDQIQIRPEMAFFIPLIGATGGNVGVQSSAIIVQGLANNTLITDKIAPKLLKELGVGLILMMNRFKINPALATGPFVTTLNDIIGISIYFLVGRILYGIL
ncbi:MAG: magnesium transporter [Bacteroidota bacterium]|nr:magnesium transporter [Bacteroidota bacterium]